MSGNLGPILEGIVTDIYNIGHRQFWLKRAEDFRRAKPVPGDRVGNRTREQLSAQWRFLDEIERACRAKAEMVGIDEELEHLLRDVA